MIREWYKMTVAGVMFIIFLLAIAGFGLYAARHVEDDTKRSSRKAKKQSSANTVDLIFGSGFAPGEKK